MYLVEDEPLTLIDCGPAWTVSLRALERGLADLGHHLDEIGLVLLTHQHVDHLGLARTVVSASGAEVGALSALEPIAVDFERHADEEDRAAADLMRMHGVADPLVEALRAVTRVNRNWGESVWVTKPLPDGGWVELRDRRFRVQHAPGHSPTDTLFIDEAGRSVFGGDHLLAHVSSNALVASRPTGEPRESRYPALLTYERSLRATRELPIDLVRPGHGDAVLDHRALVDRRLEEHSSRAAQIFDLLAQGPQTAHAIALALWERRALQLAYLTISEVLGHLDLLIADGAVVELTDERPIRFAAKP